MKTKFLIQHNNILFNTYSKKVEFSDKKELKNYLKQAKESSEPLLVIFPKKINSNTKNPFSIELADLTISQISEYATYCKIESLKENFAVIKAVKRVKLKFQKDQIKLFESNANEVEFTNAPYEDNGDEFKYQTKINKIDKLLTQMKSQSINILNFDESNESIEQLFTKGTGIADFVSVLSGCLNISFEKKYDLFISKSIDEQLEKILKIIKTEFHQTDVNMEIEKKVKENLEKQQRDFILREKLKAIRESLNDEENGDEDDEYSKNINDEKLKLIYPETIQKTIKTEAERLKGMMSGSPDYALIQNYVNVLKKLPWRKVEKEELDIKYARKTLDKYHYGLNKVKERIIEYIALIINQQRNKKNNNDHLIKIDDQNLIDLDLFKEIQETKVNKDKESYNNVPILTLVGPPGTGKTSLAKAIAQALNKKFIKISLGGVHDESEIRGHRRTYVGSMPGKIIKGIQKVGVSNPLVLLDEIDKMASDHRGDPASAMLEVLDPEQNSKFQDHFLDTEYDLSKVIFIATANYYEDIPAPLLDRVEIIELSSYTITEKIQIAKNHLIQKTIDQASLTESQFKIDDNTLEYIIKHYTSEAGVRGLKRALDKIARKIVVKVIDNPEKVKEFVINEEKVKEFLGVPRFSDDENDNEAQVGVVNGLAFTSLGGTTLQIEVTTYPGKGESIKLTGQLKDVMQESAQIALTYVKANAQKFGCDKFDFENNQIHIHVPEGAIPKDGPSAGVTFTTAIISALSKKPVPANVGMTGEITLRGKVLEIGGLKEKSFAAYKHNIKTVFIPNNNAKDIVEFPEEVKKFITFVPVKTYDEIFEHIFVEHKNEDKKTHKE